MIVMKNKLINLFFVLLLSITACSHVTDTIYVVPFEKAVNKPCFGELISLDVVEDYSFLKNIPDIECDISAINSFKMNRYVKEDSIPNQMYLFIGVNESKKEKYVVVDANKNHDFSDDLLYTFSLPDIPLTREEKLERAVGLQITPDPNKNDSVSIGVDPFNYFSYKYTSTQDKRLEVIIVFNEYMHAQTQIDDIPVEIYGYFPSNLFKRELDEKSHFTIYYNDKANKPIYNKFESSNDTIKINDKIYQLSRIKHPNIYLKEINVLVDSSSIESFLPLVNARDINDNNFISINGLINDKYVFIDFWGSWCGPCVQSIPELKIFYEKIKDRTDVLMLGVALESDKKDVEKLKEIIDNRKIEWINLWLNGKEDNNTTSIIKKLNIVAFPTYLIIDNNGKIIYKESSIGKTQEAIDFFIDLINR